MADVVFNQGMRAALLAFFGAGTFKAMLVTPSYVPDKDANESRSDVTNEITATAGYTAGGKEIAVSVEPVNDAADTIDVTFGPLTWDNLTANDIRQVVIYKALGGAASADPVVLCLDSGSTDSVVDQSYEVGLTTIRIAVPAVTP